jgi:hypothetical protein
MENTEYEKTIVDPYVGGTGHIRLHGKGAQRAG